MEVKNMAQKKLKTVDVPITVTIPATVLDVFNIEGFDEYAEDAYYSEIYNALEQEYFMSTREHAGIVDALKAVNAEGSNQVFDLLNDVNIKIAALSQALDDLRRLKRRR
jgi:hypothetical protein